MSAISEIDEAEIQYPEADQGQFLAERDIMGSRRTHSHSRSSSSTPRSPLEPGSSYGRTRFSSSYRSRSSEPALSRICSRVFGLLWGERKAKRKIGRICHRRRVWVMTVALFFLMNWYMLSRLQHTKADHNHKNGILNSISSKVELKRFGIIKKPQKTVYGRLLALAAHALAEGQNKPEPKDLWKEPLVPATSWRPCADQRSWKPSEGNNGHIMVSANGGINQQRVAVCNAVVLARFLNSTLVIPSFLYSSVWRDVSQFGDVYQEDHFINYLTHDIRIVKELPEELRSLDLEAIGSVVTDADISKESKLGFYLKNILPILLQNRVVHFLGFGNRVAFDPMPMELQM